MNLLIIDDIHPVFIEKLQSTGLKVDYQPDIERAEILRIVAGYQGLVVRSKCRIDEEIFRVASKLKFIARGGAGMDNIDEKAAAERDIALLNAPEGNRNAVAEHMVGMLLGLMNNLKKSQREIEQGQWLREDNRGLELQGRTVALIGYGNNGQAMARCLSGFGVKVIAYDKYKSGFSDEYAWEVSMEEVVRQADILSLHIPLTRETKGLVDNEYLFHFRKPIFFLNGARGEVVNVQAVLDAVNSGKVLGAAFDVLPVESFPALSEQSWYQKLITHPHILLSPHIAGWTVESYYKIADVLADKVLAFCRAR